MKHASILFFLLFLGFRLHCQIDCDKIKINYLDTVSYLTIFNKTTLDTSLVSSSQRVVLFSDSLYAIVETYDTNKTNEMPSTNCILESDENNCSKQFYSLKKTEPIPIWEAYKTNSQFVFFIIKNCANWLVKSDFCYSTSNQSNLFIQFDIEYADSLSVAYSAFSIDEIINTIEKNGKNRTKQNAESRLVIYQNNQRSDVLYLLDSAAERYSFPFGIAIYKEKYLVAGYNTVPKKGYKESFVQYLYIIDIETNTILKKINVPKFK